jgi:signal peptidase II
VRRGPAVTAAIAAAVLVIDQTTKIAVRAALPIPGASVPVLGDVLRITFTRNEGAAYGLLPGGRVWFILVSVVALVVIAGYMIRRRPERAWLVIALGLVTGGAIGNLIDRSWFGWVTDFIQIPFDFPVFNVADSSVVVGVGMLVWWLLFGPAPADAPALAPGAVELPADMPDGQV